MKWRVRAFPSVSLGQYVDAARVFDWGSELIFPELKEPEGNQIPACRRLFWEQGFISNSRAPENFEEIVVRHSNPQ